MSLVFKPDVTMDILVEVLGTLSNLTIEQFDFARLATSYDILPFIYSVMSDSLSSKHTKNATLISENDDIQLELVKILGTMCLDAGAISLMVKSEIPILLAEFMVGGGYDSYISLIFK